jgi:hypothetical protein
MKSRDRGIDGLVPELGTLRRDPQPLFAQVPSNDEFRAHRADDEGEQRAAEQSEQDDALLPSRIELVPLP